jgi:hypothetical protein
LVASRRAVKALAGPYKVLERARIASQACFCTRGIHIHSRFAGNAGGGPCLVGVRAAHAAEAQGVGLQVLVLARRACLARGEAGILPIGAPRASLAVSVGGGSHHGLILARVAGQAPGVGVVLDPQKGLVGASRAKATVGLPSPALVRTSPAFAALTGAHDRRVSPGVAIRAGIGARADSRREAAYFTRGALGGTGNPSGGLVCAGDAESAPRR